MTHAMRIEQLMPRRATRDLTLSTGSFVGLDPGQAVDPSAIAVAARYEDTAAVRRFEIVHLERLPLGTPYPAVVTRAGEIVRRLELADSPGSVHLVVDQTGVGRPVVDLLRAAALKPIPVTITGGDKVVYDAGWRVPKRELVSALQVLLQTGRLKIALGLSFAQTLVDELLRFRVRIDPLTAHDSYGAEWREGAHDDLVLAVAIACWYGQRPQPSSDIPPSMVLRTWR